MAESNGHKKRVTVKRPYPNQHVREVLETLYQGAVSVGSNIVPTLEEALSSLGRYPLPLSSGGECAILKGFDQSLCNYIDLHLNMQLSNKKTKVNEQRTSNNGRKLIEDISDTEMTTSHDENCENKKELETNRDTLPFSSQFGETINIVDTPRPAPRFTNVTQPLNYDESTIMPVTNTEKNNNTTKYDCPVVVCSRTDTFNRYGLMCNSLDVAYNAGYNNIIIENSGFSLDGDWESYIDHNYNEYQNWHANKTQICSQSILVSDQTETENLNLSKSKNSVTEIISSSDDEGSNQATNDEGSHQATNDYEDCSHNEAVVSCQRCDSVITAADAFQLYFKEKTKKDAEDFGKCILPRKMYKPAYRSGAYAILVALLEQRNECPYRDCLTKEELIQKAQKHTDQSFTHPKLESNYTAWTNAKRLINKGMIQMTNCEHRGEDVYMLTAMGRAIAMELLKEHTPKITINDVIFHGQRNDRVPSLADVVLVPPPPITVSNEEQSSVFIEMPPGTFDIVMLIDKRENIDKNLLGSPNNYCKYEARSLTVGDFLWVARSKKTGQELVLPYIVERKRLDDLSSSIKDGRFQEQKFRLRKCGLKNVIYLVENCNQNVQFNIPAETLMQAMVNISVLEEFIVVRTNSLTHTFKVLGMLSESLVHEYLPVFLQGCNMDTQGRELMTFEFFNKFSCKNKPLTVRDTFIKMLLQLKGLSVEKALAIANKYNTPRALMKAYDKCSMKEGELLLADLKFNNITCSVGPTVSKTVYKLFSQIEF